MKNKIIIVLFAAAAILACTSGRGPGDELRLYVFDCGWVRVESLEMFGIADDETDIRVAAAPCYMVEHPLGRMLWDGGVASVFAETGEWQQVGPGFWNRLDRTLDDQLADMDLDMGSFDIV